MHTNIKSKVRKRPCKKVYHGTTRVIRPQDRRGEYIVFGMDDVVSSFAVFRLPMSNFSDEEDMRLITLAASYVQLGKRVRWREIAARMTYTNKGVSVLRERLKTLKKTY